MPCSFIALAQCSGRDILDCHCTPIRPNQQAGLNPLHPQQLSCLRSVLTGLLAACAVRCLSMQKGKEGVQEQYEQTDEFHERWRLKARDVIARSAWRRQKLTKRVSCAMFVAVCAAVAMPG